VRPYLKRLAQAFGSPHYVTESSCCFASGFVAATVTLGKEYEYFLAPGRRRYPQTKCRLVWTNNPPESQIPYGTHHFLVDAPKVPTVVVDPRRTPMADAAEINLQPRPGTDGALALGLAHVIFEEHLQDQAFLDEYAHGLDSYMSYIEEFTPEKTSAITGISKDTIVAAAKRYGSSRPAQIAISPNATTHHTNGFQAHRAILLLAAICGNLDVDGGNRPWTERFVETSIDLSPSTKPPMGAKDFPLFVDLYGEAQGMLLADAIESGQVKGVFSIGMNLMMWPDSKRLDEALRTLELFTVCDFFDNPTVGAANVFFPAATHLERQALVFSGSGQVQYRPAAVTPRGDARGDTELVFEIARNLGLGHRFWDGNIHASYEARLESSNVRLIDLLQQEGPVDIPIETPEERAYKSKGFGTPTGKIEFVSTLLEKAGHPGLPVYEEPKWSPISAPEVAKDFPLILTSGGRSRNYTHSQGRELKTLREREPDPRIQIHPEDAKRRAIEDGDWVEVSSPLGAIEMRVHVTDSVPEGATHAFHGWPGNNINEVIPNHLDPISGFPPFKSSLCQVRKK
jgi:anaerobic selenocysteine-containing dehydrogenase